MIYGKEDGIDQQIIEDDTLHKVSVNHEFDVRWCHFSISPYIIFRAALKS